MIQPPAAPDSVPRTRTHQPHLLASQPLSPQPVGMAAYHFFQWLLRSESENSQALKPVALTSSSPGRGGEGRREESAAWHRIPARAVKRRRLAPLTQPGSGV